MSLSLLISNIAAWSVQVAALTTVAAIAMWALRARSPRVILGCWQTLLLITLLLPFLQSWERPSAPEEHIVFNSSINVPMQAETTQRKPVVPWREFFIEVLVLGIAVRFVGLGLGLLRLRKYVAASHKPESLASWVYEMQWKLNTYARIMTTPQLPGPVTFGLTSPHVLLPLSFAEMELAQQQSILCHELHHIRRRDWAFTILEEITTCVLWFHPAVWYITSRIQLAREQVVDRCTVQYLGGKQAYLDALLATAANRIQPDLVPASLFLKKRHLRQRVAEIMKESTMSYPRILTTLAALGGLVAFTCKFAVTAFPLVAATNVPLRPTPRVVEIRATPTRIIAQAPGVIHGNVATIPKAALDSSTEGTVIVEVRLDAQGHVIDAKALSGPDVLRSAALKTVLDWHFEKPPVTGTVKQVPVDFRLPAPRAAVPSPQPADPLLIQVTKIDVSRLPENIRQEVLAKLPFREGTTVTSAQAAEAIKAAQSVDDHITGTYFPDRRTNPLEWQLVFALPDLPTKAAGTLQTPIKTARPIYPPLARQARVQGTVKFNIGIDKQGQVATVELISGHPLLIDAAREAVQQWKYQPTVQNGQPVEVQTEAVINFSLM